MKWPPTPTPPQIPHNLQWVFAQSCAFGSSLTFFANLPNSTWSGVRCQPKTGSTSRRIKRTMNQCESEWETEAQKQTSIPLTGRTATARPSQVHLRASKQDGKIPESRVCKCVTRRCFHCKSPLSSQGQEKDYWTVPGLSVVTSINQSFTYETGHFCSST